MSKNLLDEMKACFGDSFGESRNTVINEAKEIELAVKSYVEAKPHAKFNLDSELKDHGIKISKKNGKVSPKVKAKVKQEFGSKKGQDILDKILKDFGDEKPKDDSGHEPIARHAKIHTHDRVMDPSDPKHYKKKVSKRHPQTSFRTAKGHSQGNQTNYPFKSHSSLGPGPGTPPDSGVQHPLPGGGKRHHKEKGCWHCTCPSGTYHGCNCRGTGKTADCPKGHIKKITIKPQYHRAYDKAYHKFQAKHGGIEKRKPEAEHGAKYSNKHQDKQNVISKLKSGKSEV
jgi:hypothetical protein